MKDTKKGMNYGGMVAMPKAMPKAPMKAMPKSKASPMPNSKSPSKPKGMMTKAYGGMAAGGMAKKGK
jgi:hypothetical protein